MNRVYSNKYEELEQLGQGGQGVVYKVRHVEHKTILALKVIPSQLLENPELAARFEREVQIMTRLRHRNIVEVLGSGRDASLNLSYIVMEFIQGKTRARGRNAPTRRNGRRLFLRKGWRMNKMGKRSSATHNTGLRGKRTTPRSRALPRHMRRRPPPYSCTRPSRRGKRC
ncbi:MAG TPA: protein kinase [Methylomirabilota bacterium]|jgi:serine/threonine protein kinase|nr:protein kinase [Methylomirabilota bacterium]